MTFGEMTISGAKIFARACRIPLDIASHVDQKFATLRAPEEDEQLYWSGGARQIAVVVLDAFSKEEASGGADARSRAMPGKGTERVLGQEDVNVIVR